MSDMDIDRHLRAKIADLTEECKTLRASLTAAYKAANEAVSAARTPPAFTHAGKADGWDDGFKCGVETCATVVWAAMHADNAGGEREIAGDPPNLPATRPLTEEQIVACITEAGCHGGAMRMSYGSGPYEITRPTINAIELVRAVERAHGIVAQEGPEHEQK
jgi:hypothetical protein